MKTVWKFSLPITDVPCIDMPDGAQPLFVGVQNKEPCIWALVDPNAPLKPKYFRFAGTGHLIETVGRHIGSFLDGALVFHVFEVDK